MSKTLSLTSLLAALALTCCGGGSRNVGPAREPRVGDEPAEVDDGMSVQGLTGTLRRDEVDPVMNDAANRFMACYSDALDAAPFLTGDLSLAFHVRRDGSVATVRTLGSTLGSREVEGCIHDVARGLSFPRPHGGEADFDYGPLLFNPGEGSRQPELWSPDRAADLLLASQAALGECTGTTTGFSVTLYVGPDGAVRSAGAAGPEGSDEAATCLEGVVSAFTFPEPPTWVAKLTLEL